MTAMTRTGRSATADQGWTLNARAGRAGCSYAHRSVPPASQPSSSTTPSPRQRCRPAHALSSSTALRVGKTYRRAALAKADETRVT
jgi:hypothetical protein